MIVLTIVACVSVFVASIMLFNRELNNAMRTKIDVAANVVEHEIAELLRKASFAVYAMSSNPDLIEGLLTDDVDKVISTAFILQSMSELGYCVITDKDGNVITRTHEPDNVGDNVSSLPHIRSALNGTTGAYIMQGVTVPLAASAGAPVRDSNGNIIGAVSLGYMLSDQELVHKLKELTGCEITFFRDDERIASTVLNADGSYALGTRASADISEIVLSGENFNGNIELFGEDVLAQYSPLFGADGHVVGMLFVGFFTAEDTDKVIYFVLFGALITLVVLIICIVLARYISGIIERRLEKMMTEIRERENDLIQEKELNDLQLIMLNAVIKATKIALWDMEVVLGDPVNPGNKIVWTNEFRGLMGYTDENDFPNVLNSWSDRLHPEDKERTLSAFALHMLDMTGKTPFDIEYRLLKKSNEYSYYRATGETLRDEEGRALRVAGALMDITDNKNILLKLEQAFAEAQNVISVNELQLVLLNAVIKATKIALWDMEVVLGDPVNPGNKIVWTNEFRGLMGYTDENDFPNVLNSWSDKLHPDDKERTLRAFAAHMLDSTGQTPFDVEYRLMRKNTTYAYYRATGETIRDENGLALRVAGALMDINDEKEALFEIEKQKMEAEIANSTKSTFLANMSHEIRTPMNSIIGFAELAQYGDIPVKTREYLNNIQESAQWLLGLINDILDISKIESGKIDFERIPFDLTDIFSHCQSAIIPRTVEKGIMLYCYAEPSIGKKLLGDPIRVRQIIMNLLSNAVKFTKSGTVKLLASLIKTDDKSAAIQFEVKDSGIGMTAQQIERIFEPFRQADDSITRKFGGTGLGLTITKNIIELMGGTLSVVSAPGVGSKFSFELVFDLVDDISVVKTEKITMNSFERPNFKGEVLVCEDNTLNQQVVCDHLSRVGLRTTVAYNGKEGLNAVAERMQNNEKPFDLIFMDIHMPIMDGLEAATQIKELGVKTPIVALTANIMSNDLELYKKSGMQDTVGKPFTANELWRCLVKFLPVESYTAINRSRQADEDTKTIKLMKTNFVNNNQNTLSDFITSINNGDIKKAHRIAHTIKGSASQIGEKRLQTAAAVAESMLVDGKNQLSEEHVKNFETELLLVLNDLAPLLDEAKPSVEAGPINAEAAWEMINKLEPLLLNRDTRCVKLADEAAATPGMEDLAKLIRGFKFKQALEAVEKIKERLVSGNE